MMTTTVRRLHGVQVIVLSCEKWRKCTMCRALQTRALALLLYMTRLLFGCMMQVAPCVVSPPHNLPTWHAGLCFRAEAGSAPCLCCQHLLT